MKHPPFATPQETENAFYDALEKADLEAMMAVWADDDEIVCVHPGGMRLTGVEQVREAWRQIFNGGAVLRIKLRQLQTIDGMTLTVHSVYEQISIDGGTEQPPPMIATNIYQRAENGWRMVVHHASPAPSRLETESRRGKLLH